MTHPLQRVGWISPVGDGHWCFYDLDEDHPKDSETVYRIADWPELWLGKQHAEDRPSNPVGPYSGQES